MGAMSVCWYGGNSICPDIFFWHVVFFCAILVGGDFVGDWSLAMPQGETGNGVDGTFIVDFRSILEDLHSHFLWMNFHKHVDRMRIKI